MTTIQAHREIEQLRADMTGAALMERLPHDGFCRFVKSRHATVHIVFCVKDARRGMAVNYTPWGAIRAGCSLIRLGLLAWWEGRG